MELKGKNAIVTGAGRGIGREIALQLGAQGVNVLAVSRTLAEVERTAADISKMGVLGTALAADISNNEDIVRIVDAAQSAFGSIDILVNNAGVLMHDGIDDLNEADWDKTMSINVRGTAFLSRAVMLKMKANEESYVINISSTAALGAKPDVTSYSVSKYGVTGLTEALYKYGRDYNIRVSAIFPGVTDTEMLQSADMPCTQDMLMKPSDIAYCVLFLLRSPARMIVKEVVPWATKFDKI